jgi:hypothetical protein
MRKLLAILFLFALLNYSMAVDCDANVATNAGLDPRFACTSY